MRTDLKVLRIKNGWSQREIAEKLGISTGSYSLIENGKRFGSPKTWEKIKEIYNLENREMWEIQHQEN